MSESTQSAGHAWPVILAAVIGAVATIVVAIIGLKARSGEQAADDRAAGYQAALKAERERREGEETNAATAQRRLEAEFEVQKREIAGLRERLEASEHRPAAVQSTPATSAPAARPGGQDTRAAVGGRLVGQEGPKVASNGVGHPRDPAPERAAFETESYSVRIESLRRQGDSLRLVLIFENITETLIHLQWVGDMGDHTYLVDERGNKWPLYGSDSQGIVWRSGMGAVEVAAGTKLRSTFVFSARVPSDAHDFTLVSTEASPMRRAVSIHGLRDR